MIIQFSHNGQELNLTKKAKEMVKHIFLTLQKQILDIDSGIMSLIIKENLFSRMIRSKDYSCPEQLAYVVIQCLMGMRRELRINF